MKKKLGIAVLSFVLMMGLNACGSKSEGTPISVNIKDGYTTTILETYEGHTVEAMLKEADIAMGEKDEVTPDLTETVPDGGAIIIGRFASVQIVYHDNKPITVELCGATVQDALDHAEIKINDKDYVDADADCFLEDGMVINISQRAEVTLTADGETKKYVTGAKTVGEFLEENDVELGKRDRISEKEDSEIKDGMEIVIKRVKIKTVTETEDIPYTTTYEDTSSMYTDQTSVKSSGQYGEKEITYKITYVDGEEESREVEKETVLKEPVAEVVLRGTMQRVQQPQQNTGGNGNGGNGTGGGGGGNAVVSVQYFDDCDGSGHGTKVTTYADGTQVVENY